jgi:hypothetical protein
MNRNKPRLRFDYRLFAANDKQQLPEILHWKWALCRVANP